MQTSPRVREIPFDLVVIGGTGDLAKRKLFPALYVLAKHLEISPQSRLFAVARHPTDAAAFHRELGPQVALHIDEDERDIEALGSFWKKLEYRSLSATSAEELLSLRELLGPDGDDRPRLFYLATPPDLYGDIARAIADAGLIHPETRIVLEKPIGHDLESAQAINAAVGERFPERQIYRIDHYLGKETVQNLMALRFGNALLEPMWQSQLVDHVQITVAETLGMEGRGSYYDKSGALRDMIQNHLLQLLCLTAMEPPARMEQEAIRQEKLKVLRSLRPISVLETKSETVRGQYRSGAVGGQSVVGYTEEADVPEDSVTETFVALRVHVDNWRWGGVPFYLRTGKRMGHRVSEIVIQFKRVPHVLFADQPGELEPNRLVIRLQPDESIKLALMMKAPGSRVVLRREVLNLNLKEREGERTLSAYERLLLDVVRGTTTLFMHREEVEEAWRWSETVLRGWQETGGHPRYYVAGTWGPPESVALIVRDGRNWYEHVV